jgi:DNA-binding MarR family transcriptional regulator
MARRLPHTTARAAPENLAILLREPFRAATDHVHRRLAEAGHPEVRQTHGAVFQFVDDDGTRVGVLAERARMAKQSMAELVEHLERHGYVERLPDPHDRRARLVRVTPRGHEVYRVARAAWAETLAAWTAALGEGRLAELRTLLEQLNAALED